MVNFADLDAMDDADWDKVSICMLTLKSYTDYDSAGMSMLRAVSTFSKRLCLHSMLTLKGVPSSSLHQLLYVNMIGIDSLLGHSELISQIQNRASSQVAAACHMPSLREQVGGHGISIRKPDC